MFGLAHHATVYERLAGVIARPLHRRVTTDVMAAELPTGARVLDAGTGPGLLPVRIAAACPHLTVDAVDLAPEMIDRARRGPGASTVTFTVADVADLPFGSGTFDLVVSSISQHHWVDPAAGMREIARVLRPGGRAWIYDFRPALGRACRAAQALSPQTLVARQSPLPGSSWLSPIGRIVLEPIVLNPGGTTP
jgi:ubiquinone/menaquinone biosynthesis C-methylase UbiE